MSVKDVQDKCMYCNDVFPLGVLQKHVKKCGKKAKKEEPSVDDVINFEQYESDDCTHIFVVVVHDFLTLLYSNDRTRWGWHINDRTVHVCNRKKKCVLSPL